MKNWMASLARNCATRIKMKSNWTELKDFHDNEYAKHDNQFGTAVIFIKIMDWIGYGYGDVYITLSPRNLVFVCFVFFFHFCCCCLVYFSK